MQSPVLTIIGIGVRILVRFPVGRLSRVVIGVGCRFAAFNLLGVDGCVDGCFALTDLGGVYVSELGRLSGFDLLGVRLGVGLSCLLGLTLFDFERVRFGVDVRLVLASLLGVYGRGFVRLAVASCFGVVGCVVFRSAFLDLRRKAVGEFVALSLLSQVCVTGGILLRLSEFARGSVCVGVIERLVLCALVREELGVLDRLALLALFEVDEGVGFGFFVRPAGINLFGIDGGVVVGFARIPLLGVCDGVLL